MGSPLVPATQPQPGVIFPLGGVQQGWTVVIRYTHDVQKSAEGRRIRCGNPVGLERVNGKRLV